MGLFDIFQRKEVGPNRRIAAMHGHVQTAFSTVHDSLTDMQDNMQKQQEWLKYIHQHHLSLHNQHTDHKELTKTELRKVNSWITFLHKSMQKQESTLAALQKQLEQSHTANQQYFSEMQEHIMALHQKAAEKREIIVEKEPDHDVIAEKVLDQLSRDLDVIKQSIKQDIHSSVSQKIQETHVEHLQQVEELLAATKAREVQKVPVIAQPALSLHQTEHKEQMHWNSQLTNPEQKLLNLLMTEPDPVTYTKISQLTGHNINTVRVNMNTLKKKGLVEESSLPSGVKLFAVVNKERVKKMYNVSVL